MYKNIDWFLITIGLATVGAGIWVAVHIMYNMELFNVATLFVMAGVTGTGWILIAIGAMGGKFKL